MNGPSKDLIYNLKDSKEVYRLALLVGWGGGPSSE